MTFFRANLTTLILLPPLLLAACSLPGPATGPEPKLPVAWKNAGDFPVAAPTKDLERWWSRFEDPTLNRVIARSLHNSPDMATSAARVREARARRAAQRATLFPNLDGNASASSRSTRSDSADSNSRSYSAGLSASWDADLFGRNRSSLEVAAANLGAAEENLHSVEAGLAAEVATVYTILRANEARLSVLKRNIATREQTAQLAAWRLKAGEADSLEYNQAQSSLESAKAGVPALEQAIAQGRNALALLAGDNPGSLDATLAAGRGIPYPSRALAIGIPADILRQRPDVRVAGYQVLAAAAATQAANADRFPSLNLSGSLGINALGASRIFNPETTTASIIAGLSAPIFDAGRLRANLEASTAQLDQTIEGYRSSVLLALSETENALIACRRTAERLTTLEEATRLAREADDLAQKRYQAGVIDFTDVLDTQRSLLALEDSLLNTSTDRTTAYIRLYQALGGGWSS
jgi:NodT family efflux transporter outer membrane factor (OMF) lipoprotein